MLLLTNSKYLDSILDLITESNMSSSRIAFAIGLLNTVVASSLHSAINSLVPVTGPVTGQRAIVSLVARRAPIWQQSDYGIHGGRNSTVVLVTLLYAIHVYMARQKVQRYNTLFAKRSTISVRASVRQRTPDALLANELKRIDKDSKERQDFQRRIMGISEH